MESLNRNETRGFPLLGSASTEMFYLVFIDLEFHREENDKEPRQRV